METITTLVQDHAFKSNPNLNRQTEFRIRETKVKGLWDAIRLRVFTVDECDRIRTRRSISSSAFTTTAKSDPSAPLSAAMGFVRHSPSRQILLHLFLWLRTASLASRPNGGCPRRLENRRVKGLFLCQYRVVSVGRFRRRDSGSSGNVQEFQSLGKRERLRYARRARPGIAENQCGEKTWMIPRRRSNTAFRFGMRNRGSSMKGSIRSRKTHNKACR